jgi:hypothetical protein
MIRLMFRTRSIAFGDGRPYLIAMRFDTGWFLQYIWSGRSSRLLAGALVEVTLGWDAWQSCFWLGRFVWLLPWAGLLLQASLGWNAPLLLPWVGTLLCRHLWLECSFELLPWAGTLL